MAGGFIEGFKKIYSGKNIFAKHILLVLLSLIISLVSSIASINANGEKAAAYEYMYVQNPILGIITLVAGVVIGLYLIHFMHNSLKYLVWKDTQTDAEKVKAFDIMPEVDGKIFSHFGKYLGFGILWCIYMTVLLILGVATCFIPGFHIGGIIISVILFLIIYLSIPFIFISFAKNYTIKGNISPLLLFSYLPKIALPATVLYLKFLGVMILYCIASVIIAFGIIFTIGIFAGLTGMDPLTIKDFVVGLPVTTLIGTIIIYLSIIISLGFYYAAAVIYHKKIDALKNPEE